MAEKRSESGFVDNSLLTFKRLEIHGLFRVMFFILLHLRYQERKRNLLCIKSKLYE